jgi:hypothetical protein
MKRSELRNLIKEVIEESYSSSLMEDDIGEFYLVVEPILLTDMGDILFKLDMRGFVNLIKEGLDETNIRLITKDEAKAVKYADELLKIRGN